MHLVAEVIVWTVVIFVIIAWPVAVVLILRYSIQVGILSIAMFRLGRRLPKQTLPLSNVQAQDDDDEIAARHSW